MAAGLCNHVDMPKNKSKKIAVKALGDGDCKTANDRSVTRALVNAICAAEKHAQIASAKAEPSPKLTPPVNESVTLQGQYLHSRKAGA